MLLKPISFLYKASSGGSLADISFIGRSYTTYTSRTNTTISATLNAGSITDGDILLFDMLTADGSEAVDPTPPAGLTQIGSMFESTGEDLFNLELRSYFKVASSESGDYTFTHTTGLSQGALRVFRNVDTSTPQDVTSTTNEGTGTTSTWTGVTTVTDKVMIAAFGYDWADTTNNLTPPSGMTESIDTELIYAAHEIITTAGATGNRSHTNNASLAQSHWGCRLVALRPKTV